jgi:hypothetical protein
VRALAIAIATLLALVGCSQRPRGDSPMPAPGVADGPTAMAPGSAPPAAHAPVTPNEGPFFVPDPTHKVVPILRDDAPSYRYSRLDRDTCEAELVRRNVPFARGEPTEGVLAPVRLRGPVRGVAIHTGRPAKEREKSIYEVFDCRLVLALDDFAGLLARHDVVEMIHINAYRPKSQYGCTARYWGLQHCAALAVDVRSFKKKDGTVLEVERDFHGRIGLALCVSGVGPSPRTPAADELWGFVCEAAQRALFHVMLTPNYNAEHRNHFHLEITPEAGWMMIK